jgi:hypothetical protein
LISDNLGHLGLKIFVLNIFYCKPERRILVWLNSN